MKIDLADDGYLKIHISTLVEHEPVMREIAKNAVFDESLLIAFAQIAISGQVQWPDEDAYGPWSSYTTGKGETFEKLRQIIATQADAVAAKLVKDLTAERDKLYTENDKRQGRIWELERRIHELEREAGSKWS